MLITSFKKDTKQIEQINQRGEKGFGYDALFVPAGFSTTFAEMSGKEKSLISHRAIAMKKFSHFFDV